MKSKNYGENEIIHGNAEVVSKKVQELDLIRKSNCLYLVSVFIAIIFTFLKLKHNLKLIFINFRHCLNNSKILNIYCTVH